MRALREIPEKRENPRVSENEPDRLPAPWHGLEAFRPTLRKFLTRRCRDQNEADDLIQETLLRAARYRRHLLDRGRLRSWLVQIAANVFRDHMRRSRRRPSVGYDEELFERVEGAEPAPGEAGEGLMVELAGELVDEEVVLSHLAAAFGGLLDRDRRILSAYYYGAGDTAAAAAECGIPSSLVKVRLFRARRRLERAVRVLATESRARRLAGLAACTAGFVAEPNG